MYIFNVKLPPCLLDGARIAHHAEGPTALDQKKPPRRVTNGRFKFGTFFGDTMGISIIYIYIWLVVSWAIFHGYVR